MDSSSKVNILVVDDRPDRVLTLTAILEELGENVISAASGREALRQMLRHEFALVLLDIHMPGMDGFETAALIRQRPSTRDVPIIFITAYQDEVQLVQGYSLGAVDYIQVPVVPDILRTKVGVLVELYRKTEQVRRQADWLRRRAAQLHKLTSASLAINSAISLETLLEVVTDTAREILDVHAASATAVLDERGQVVRSASAVSDKYADVDAVTPSDEQKSAEAKSGIREILQRTGRPLRMTRRELEDYPAWAAQEKTWGGRPLSGLLAAPLSGRDGRNLGWIEVTDKVAGEFDGDDEAILVQLAQMASIAIENAVFAQEREISRLKDEFLWTLSHELRTPLNAILGWTQLLAQGGNQQDTARALEVIERNARAQAKLIEDMLDLSRIIMGKLRLNRRPLDLRQAVEAAVESMRPVSEANDVRLEQVLPPEPLYISGDADRLQQVVGNLLSNALKFTPRGGRVSVALAEREAFARITVSDTGQGIKPQFLPHVFERFRQADSSTTRAHGGLGIGLTIVRHITELHGGRVEADSAGEGRGAVFTIELPIEARVMRPPAAVSPDEATVRTGARIDGVRVLLIDDDADSLGVISTLLERLGAHVMTAGSAAEAFAILDRWMPDVLVSDIGMPDRDGYDLISSLRKLPAARGGNLPAVALTAYAREQDGVRARSAGFQLHLGKPVDPATLAESVMGLYRERCQRLNGAAAGESAGGAARVRPPSRSAPAAPAPAEQH